jgi:hypothetical protein
MRSALASTRLVTLIDTTAGDTWSKMSAKDMGAPGGGAKIGAVEARMSCGWSAWAAGNLTPAPATAAAITPAPARAPRK